MSGMVFQSILAPGGFYVLPSRPPLHLLRAEINALYSLIEYLDRSLWKVQAGMLSGGTILIIVSPVQGGCTISVVLILPWPYLH